MADNRRFGASGFVRELTLRKCNIYCFSTANTVTRTRRC